MEQSLGSGICAASLAAWCLYDGEGARWCCWAWPPCCVHGCQWLLCPRAFVDSNPPLVSDFIAERLMLKAKLLLGNSAIFIRAKMSSVVEQRPFTYHLFCNSMSVFTATRIVHLRTLCVVLGHFRRVSVSHLRYPWQGTHTAQEYAGWVSWGAEEMWWGKVFWCHGSAYHDITSQCQSCHLSGLFGVGGGRG